MQNVFQDSLNIPRISLLTEHLIDQIKAGEVIESPANMAKELIENAIDAKATKITIHIKSDPLEFFSISDNGHGIHPEDLPLVFARHATSKIHHYNDIYELASYGFRGEALASLGAVAKVQIKSKVRSLPTHILEHQNGVNTKIRTLNDQTQDTSGTEITVTDLFAATPVRLKFIQSKLTEIQKFRKIIHAYIIAYPDITWDLHEDKDFVRYINGDSKARYQKLISSNLIKKELEYRNAKIELLIDDNPSKKRNTLNQFIYVNKRPINFSLLHSIIVKNLNTSPSYALFIETEQSDLDINVHPAKTEVKFFDKATILSLVSTILKSLISPIKNSSNAHTHSDSATQNTDYKDYGSQSHDFQTHNTSYEHFSFLSKNQIIDHGLRIDKLISYLLEDTRNNINHEGTPLLVSSPFHLSPFQFSMDTMPYLDVLNYWSQFGLVTSTIEQQTLIIKSLPEGWIYTNFEALIKFLILHNIKEENIIITNELKNIINTSSLNLLFEHLGTQTLKNLRIIQDLEHLHIHD